MSATCPTCGAIVPFLNGCCSAGVDVVCRGRDFIQGCGHALTNDERHWYGSTCEQCECDWLDRVEAWRSGGKDHELDALYGSAQPITH